MKLKYIVDEQNRIIRGTEEEHASRGVLPTVLYDDALHAIMERKQFCQTRIEYYTKKLKELTHKLPPTFQIKGTALEPVITK